MEGPASRAGPRLPRTGEPGQVRAGESRLDIDAFIDRWSAARGGAERANYQMFLTELCEALDLPRPDPASDQTALNDYVFERGVKRRESEGSASTLRIDLYKRLLYPRGQTVPRQPEGGRGRRPARPVQGRRDRLHRRQ